MRLQTPLTLVASTCVRFVSVVHLVLICNILSDRMCFVAALFGAGVVCGLFTFI